MIYKNPVCRGSWLLGNNCRICERCVETKPPEQITAYTCRHGCRYNDLMEAHAATQAELNEVKARDAIKGSGDYR